MIQNLADLARECGSGISDPSRQQSDIAKSILSHSDGLVRSWVHTDEKGINLLSKYGTTSMRFPFDGDTFWQNVEWLHEEALVDEEDYQAGLPY
jgi:hypothetical protein